MSIASGPPPGCPPDSGGGTRSAPDRGVVPVNCSTDYHEQKRVE